MARSILTVLVVVMASIAPLPACAAERPNIVVVLLDDLPALDDRLWQRLPVIRALFVDAGVRFTNAYGETPLCCPGRAGWLTGLHTHNHGVEINEARLFDPAMTLATQLDGVGYHTLYAGKYFNRYARLARKVPPGWDHFAGFTTGYYDYRIWRDGVRERRGSRRRDYATDVLRDLLLADLRAAPADQPVFVFAAFSAPHAPHVPARRHLRDARCRDLGWSPPSFNEEDVSDKPIYVAGVRGLTLARYDLVDECRMLLAVDEAVGALRDELIRQGRWHDTLVVLTTDNGMNAGAHRLSSKGTPYSTPVSLLMHWPRGLGALPPDVPRDVDHLLSNIDLAPTLCALAGCTLGPYPNGQPVPDGASFVGLVTGAGAIPQRDAILEAMPQSWFAPTFVVPPWHGLRSAADSPWSALGCDTAATSGCRWHYVEYETGERELYDVRNGPCSAWKPGDVGDPCELTNLAKAGEHEELMGGLAARLAALRAEGGSPTAGTGPRP